MIEFIYVVQEKKTYDEYSITSVHDICAYKSDISAYRHAELLTGELSDQEKAVISFSVKKLPFYEH